MQLLLASGNQKKLAELRRIATPLGVEVLSPADVGGLPEVVEDGATFAANAAKKAASGARHAGLWTLADDSGLSVDALDGAPGVFSARYAGTHGDDEANNAKLLSELQHVPDEGRGAEFLCALALARPESGEIAHETMGRTRGEILHEAQGEGGFGYDPLFRFSEPGFPVTDRVFATLSAEEKASVSHRGRALRDLEPALARLLQDS
ncbi:MAG: RdgB/HAM1 family non-canonical purine NTP pyrophosphatase [Planctomycetota bacterium]